MIDNSNKAIFNHLINTLLPMSFRQQEYITALDQFGSFSGAAGISQSTPRAQITRYETSTSTKIFDRSVRPIKTTSIGAPVVKQIKTVLSLKDKLEKTARLYRISKPSSQR